MENLSPQNSRSIRVFLLAQLSCKQAISRGYKGVKFLKKLKSCFESQNGNEERKKSTHSCAERFLTTKQNKTRRFKKFKTKKRHGNIGEIVNYNIGELFTDKKKTGGYYTSGVASPNIQSRVFIACENNKFLKK